MGGGLGLGWPAHLYGGLIGIAGMIGTALFMLLHPTRAAHKYVYPFGIMALGLSVALYGDWFALNGINEPYGDTILVVGCILVAVGLGIVFYWDPRRKEGDGEIKKSNQHF